MAKLHELLAVEGDLEGEFKKILQETFVTLTKKQELFKGAHRKLAMFEESRAAENTEEFMEITTTVNNKLDYNKDAAIRYFDAILQKEASNQEAKADLIVDGVTLAPGLPATFLLGMESRLKMLREVYLGVPTLAPGVKWEPAPESGEGVYKTAHPEITFKTEKTFKVKVLYEATKEHPAQVKELPETENVGKYTKYLWSGMLSPAEKSRLIGRVDSLLRAVKKARQRANTVEVKKMKIGKILFDYIHSERLA